MTIAESRVLRAINLLDREARNYYAGVPEAQDAVHFLHGYKSILDAVRVVSIGRKSSERNIYTALANLVERGHLEASAAGGMGGSIRLWIRTELPS